VLPAFVLIVAGNLRGTKLKAALGAVAWFVFGFWLRGPLIGLRPFG
jgi:hypothetical protein